jgi:hypothetical protein
MTRSLLLLVVAAALAAPELTLAADRAEAERAAREALESSAQFPWYDADKQQVRPVELRPYKAPKQAWDWEMNWRTRNYSWQGFWRAVQYLMWMLLAAIFGFGLYLLVKSIGRSYLAEDGLGEGFEDDHRTEADRIESLPFRVQRPRADLLGEARRHYQMGNYQEAIIYLFSYQLVKLDEEHFIRLAKGKTNRQYLSEIRRSRRLRRLLTQSMLAFEDVFFGHHMLGKERFEDCWNQLDDFHEWVQQSP